MVWNRQKDWATENKTKTKQKKNKKKRKFGRYWLLSFLAESSILKRNATYSQDSEKIHDDVYIYMRIYIRIISIHKGLIKFFTKGVELWFPKEIVNVLVWSEFLKSEYFLWFLKNTLIILVGRKTISYIFSTAKSYICVTVNRILMRKNCGILIWFC